MLWYLKRSDLGRNEQADIMPLYLASSGWLHESLSFLHWIYIWEQKMNCGITRQSVMSKSYCTEGHFHTFYSRPWDWSYRKSGFNPKISIPAREGSLSFTPCYYWVQTWEWHKYGRMTSKIPAAIISHFDVIFRPINSILSPEQQGQFPDLWHHRLGVFPTLPDFWVEGVNTHIFGLSVCAFHNKIEVQLFSSIFTKSVDNIPLVETKVGIDLW